MAAEPETELITDCEMTKTCGQDGSDPVVGEQMISRDCFHETAPRPRHTGVRGEVPRVVAGEPFFAQDPQLRRSVQ